MRFKCCRLIACSSALLFMTGCVINPPNVKPVTDVDPVKADGSYWLNQPAVTSVNANNFDSLWTACREEVYSRFFALDRQDFRSGFMTTEPMVSKQFFELWRRDAVTVHDVESSSLATIRRTVQFRISKTDGGYKMEPRVLVERYSSSERRLTSIVEYQAAFSGPRVEGDAQTDAGLALPTDYWYATGRDNALEKDLANMISQRLLAQKSNPSPTQSDAVSQSK